FQMLVAGCPVLLQTLLETPQLVFHLLDRAVERRKYCLGFGDGDKLVVMFGPGSDFQNRPLLMLQIDCDTDRRQSIKKLPDNFDLFLDFVLRSLAEMTVASRNRRLHRCYSKA